MLEINNIQYFEIFIGLLSFWIGVYVLSQDIRSTLSWIVFFFFLGMGIILYTDPLVANSPTFNIYYILQKITDWPLFFMPVFAFHISLLVSNFYRGHKRILTVSYLLAAGFLIADIRGGLILQENIIRFDDYMRLDGFEPGILMIPYVSFAVFNLIGSIIFFRKTIKAGYPKYIYPIIGSLILAITAISAGVAFYIKFDWFEAIFDVMLGTGILLYVYSVVRHHKFVTNERNIFDKSFLYRTFNIAIFVGIYGVILRVINGRMTFKGLLLFIIVLPLVMFSHTIYDWINTFINDLLYNPTSGFSVVNDEEVGGAIKNYNTPEKLENSPLLRLKAVNSKLKDQSAPVDGLRKTVEEAIEYFKPKEDPHRRTKRNLKYHLLKMLAFDQAEEGQILWELGFDEYPTRLMAGGADKRQPLFARFYPSDYTYISRNAYLALKKEAIHDITWRISYLEKLAKRKLF